MALTLECDPKWVDNLLSHHALTGVVQSRQGVERRVNDEGLIVIEATRRLASDLGIPLAKAVAIATEAARRRNEADGTVAMDSGITITIPFRAIDAYLRERLIEAIETLGRVARGRPRRALH